MNKVTILQGFEPPKRKSLKVWRYLDLEKFESLLSKQAVYFASAKQFEDAFEGSITRRHYDFQLRKTHPDIANPTSLAFKELTRLTKISCWHINEYESDAMWKLYLRNGKGIAIQTTIGRLEKSFFPYKIKPEYGEESIHLGKVKYIDYRNDVMDDKSMLGRFFYKKKSFSYERELRLAVSLRLAEEYGVKVPEDGIFVNVDLENLVSAVYLAPAVDDIFKEKVNQLLKKYNFDFKIEQSEMDDEVFF